MFNLEKAHFILDEMVLNGCIVDVNKSNVLAPIYLMERMSQVWPPSWITRKYLFRSRFCGLASVICFVSNTDLRNFNRRIASYVDFNKMTRPSTKKNNTQLGQQIVNFYYTPPRWQRIIAPKVYGNCFRFSKSKVKAWANTGSGVSSCDDSFVNSGSGDLDTHTGWLVYVWIPK